MPLRFVNILIRLPKTLMPLLSMVQKSPEDFKLYFSTWNMPMKFFSKNFIGIFQVEKYSLKSSGDFCTMDNKGMRVFGKRIKMFTNLSGIFFNFQIKMEELFYIRILIKNSCGFS